MIKLPLERFPKRDCTQIPLDEKFNAILIYSYTDSPDRPYDAFIYEQYNIPEETPLYLHMELWAWGGERYIKKEHREELIPKEIAEELVEKHLKFIIPTHEADMSYKIDFEFKHKVSTQIVNKDERWKDYYDY